MSLKYLGIEEFKIENRSTIEVLYKDEQILGFALKENIQITEPLHHNPQLKTIVGGEMFFLPPNSKYKIYNSSGKIAHLVLIRFRCEGGGDSTVTLFHEICSFRMPQANYWIKDFMSVGNTQDKAPYYRLQSHLYAIVSAFLERIQKPKRVDNGLMDYVEQAKNHMQEHFNTTVDVEEIARLSGSSSSRFYQAFKRHTGLSPNKFITMTRLNESLSLLSNSSLIVMDVAHSVGYVDELYFSRLFKKHMGMAPREYAASANRRIANLSPVFQGDLSVLGITPKISLERGWSQSPDNYIEQIKNCKPDLILTSPVSEELYQILSGIAPVLVLHWKQYSWKERLMKISHALNLTTVAERWLAYFDMKIENARFHIRQNLGGEPFLVVGAQEGRFRVFGMQVQKMRDLFYDDLQVKVPIPAEHISFLDTMSIRDVAALDCDNVLFLVQSSVPDSFCMRLEEEWNKLKTNRRNTCCLFIRHTEPLLYNAAVHESLIEQTVQLLQLSK